MGLGRWLPPVLLVVLFGGVAAVDLYRAVQAPAADGPTALPLTAARFLPDDYVLDLRRQPRRTASLEATAQVTAVSGWGDAVPGGRWTDKDHASLVVNLPVGGQQVLFLDCRADHRRGPPPRLALTVNGTALPPLEVRGGFVVLRRTLAPGVLRAGDNRIELALRSGRDGGRAASGRALLLRRLAMVKAPDSSFPDVLRRPRVRLDKDHGRLLIRAPGRLVLPFDVPRAGSSLTLRYRFRNGGAAGACRAVLGRTYARPEAVDIMAEEPLRARRGGAGVLHLSLGHHTGGAVLWVQTDRASAADGVVLQRPVLTPRGGQAPGASARS